MAIFRTPQGAGPHARHDIHESLYSTFRMFAKSWNAPAALREKLRFAARVPHGKVRRKK
jgi:hypothetical protein